jgi:hypothetical protein
MEPVTVKLAVPLKDKDQVIDSVTFTRRIQAKDFRGLPAALDQNANMLLISRLTGVELRLIDQMDGADYLEVSEVISSFLTLGPKIGQPPSAS